MKRVFVILCLSSTLALPQTWDAVGPYGGWINDLATDAAGNIYAAGYVGGVFKTTDNGNTWVQIYNDTLIIDPQSVALNSSGHIFVGTPQQGFFRSTNGGTSWQKMNNSLNTRNVVALLVLANGDILAGCWPGGVYRSSDNGTTFTGVNTGLTNSDVRSLGVKSGNGYLFAATHGGGVFRSTDGGVSWSAVNNGIASNAQMNWLGMNPAGDIYANGPSLYRSTDNGGSWTNLSSAITAFQTDIAFAPNAMYAASGNRVRKSTDGGATWTQETGVPDMIFVSIIVSGNSIIAGSGGLGTYRSDGTISPSDTWTHIVNGMTNTHVVAIDEAPNGDLYAATRLAGIWRSTDSGLTWFSVSSGIPPSTRFYGLAVSPTTGTVFVAGQGAISGGGYRSTDQGATWITTSFLSHDGTAACNPQGHVFTGTEWNVHRSTNDGVLWTSSQISLGTNIADFAFDRDTVYVATGWGSSGGTSRGVYRSTNNGNAWAAFNDGLTNLNVTTIAARESSLTLGIAEESATRRVIGGTWGSGSFELIFGEWVPCGPNSGNIVILDEGDFSIVLGLFLGGLDLFAIDSHCIVADLDSPRNVEAAIIRRITSGQARLVEVTFLGTKGSGIFRGTGIVNSIEQAQSIPQCFSLEQNYPNPFNPTTTIRYDLPSAGFVSIKVFDVLGREVATLVNKVEDAGVKTLAFDASTFSSGIYFYRLRAGSNFETRKMVLMK